MASNGITQPTEVQQMSIPGLLKGGDAIVQAKTGTGKTLAFLLPIFEKLNLNAVGAPQALIIAPTRELALQIATEANKLAAAYEGVRILAAYGGQDVERQLRKLEGGCHLVVGTPGRLLDHMGRGTLDLTKIRTLVLDEADQMLHMGFLPDVEKMINATSPARQTMLFSATIPDGIRRLSAQYMRTPKDIRVGPAESVPLKLIRQLVVECTPRGKLSALREYLEQEKPYLAVIFCRTKKRAAELNQQLKELGYSSDELHGDLSQNKREQVMRAFREAKLQLLVATDVAARGIDVEGITHVFNYDIPQDAEYYIHRIGRTGRAGETGKAITFVTPHDRDELQAIEQGTSQKLERQIARTSIESDDSGELLSNVEAKAGRRATHKSRDQDRKKMANVEMHVVVLTVKNLLADARVVAENLLRLQSVIVLQVEAVQVSVENVKNLHLLYVQLLVRKLKKQVLVANVQNAVMVVRIKLAQVAVLLQDQHVAQTMLLLSVEMLPKVVRFRQVIQIVHVNTVELEVTATLVVAVAKAQVVLVENVPMAVKTTAVPVDATTVRLRVNHLVVVVLLLPVVRQITHVVVENVNNYILSPLNLKGIFYEKA